MIISLRHQMHWWGRTQLQPTAHTHTRSHSQHPWHVLNDIRVYFSCVYIICVTFYYSEWWKKETSVYTHRQNVEWRKTGRFSKRLAEYHWLVKMMKLVNWCRRKRPNWETIKANILSHVFIGSKGYKWNAVSHTKKMSFTYDERQLEPSTNTRIWMQKADGATVTPAFK